MYIHLFISCHSIDLSDAFETNSNYLSYLLEQLGYKIVYHIVQYDIRIYTGKSNKSFFISYNFSMKLDIIIRGNLYVYNSLFLKPPGCTC